MKKSEFFLSHLARLPVLKYFQNFSKQWKIKEVIHLFVLQPSFGYFIRSPEKREPVALIRKSDVSRSNFEKEMAPLNHDLFPGNGLNKGGYSNFF